jgi:hypothetical protein
MPSAARIKKVTDMESTNLHECLLRTHGLLHESATLILSSGMKILYASPEAQDIIRELKGSLTRPEPTVPPSILAYVAQRIMKQIQIQRVVGDFAPIGGECSIRSGRRSYHCSSLGIPSKDAIDEAQIILVLRETRWTSVHLQPRQPLESSRFALWFHFSKLQSKTRKRIELALTRMM